MILIDTDVCIEILRGNKKVISKRKQYEGIVSISTMTIGELFYGAEKSKSREHNVSLIEEFILTVTVITADIFIMKKFAEIKASLQKRSNLLADADILIGATALTKCEKLITGNKKHFERIENLIIEDWIR